MPGFDALGNDSVGHRTSMWYLRDVVTWAYTYDHWNRLAKVTDVSNNPTSYAYNCPHILIS